MSPPRGMFVPKRKRLRLIRSLGLFMVELIGIEPTTS